jgi:ubiquinone/menaquinone biosynthesis C-methylase UbiE
MNDLETIAEAFSRTAAKYDALTVDNPHLTRMRHKVYDHVSRNVETGGRILELNAGTGIDAVALAQRGYTVHATDIAPDMLARARQKVESYGLQGQVSVQDCSYDRLDQIVGTPYDAVFSNFGGLNCIPDLSPIIEQLPLVLRPGGVVTWVMMPPVCLWEMAEVLRGQFKVAFRRWKRNGVRSHLEGKYFTVWYFSPQRARRWFGSEYELLDLEGLSVITPTGNSKAFAKRYKRLYGFLSWLDDRLSRRAPWWGWGDFYILSMRYNPRHG